MSQYPILNNRPIDQWKVTELKEELRRRKISVTGLKQELVRKLDEALRNEMPVTKDEVANNSLEPVSDCQNNGDQLEEEPLAKDHRDVAADTTGKSENDAAIVDSDGRTLDVSQDIKDQDGERVSHSGVDAMDVEATKHEVLVEDSATESQSTVTHNNSSHQDSTSDEKLENLNAALVDANVILSEADNQVPVVSPDLGSQVKSESISTDSVSIIEKNKLKDNLNADNFHLELEVKPEMVQPSSSNIPLLGGDLHPLKDDEEQVKDLSSLEDIDAKNTTDLDLVKKEDSVDVGSPEKLNLDRSSGDESMEEDLLETKNAVPSINSEDPEETVEVNKAPAVEEQCNSDANMSVSIQGEIDNLDEEKNKPTVLMEKRKLEDNAAVGDYEPVKRQRCWSSETLKLPEQQTSDLSTSSTPKDAFQPAVRRTFARTDSKPIDDSPKERIVPPPQNPATTSLRIDKFVRPFTLKAVQEMLAKTGTVCSFWMDHIKTHCYVTFESVEQATATRNAVYNLRWPSNGGNLLIAEFVDPQEVKVRAEGPPPSTAPISPSPSKPKGPHFQQSQPSQARQHSLQQQLPPPPPLPQPPTPSDPPARELLPPPPPLPKKPEPPAVTLDDLFKKTKATPRIYYLPLTDEQIAAKLAAQARNARE